MLKKFKEDLPYLCILAIGFSFIGWLAENLVRLVSLGIIDCRLYLLPFIPVYGLIAFAFYLVIGNPNKISFFGKYLFKVENKKTRIYSNLLSIILIVSMVFLGELAVGNFYEAVFGVSLWNYSSLPLIVTQYAGLIPALGYGLGAYLILKFVYWPTLEFLKRKVSYRMASFIGYIGYSILIIDFIIMVLQIAINHQGNMYWSFKVK